MVDSSVAGSPSAAWAGAAAATHATAHSYAPYSKLRVGAAGVAVEIEGGIVDGIGGHLAEAQGHLAGGPHESVAAQPDPTAHRLARSLGHLTFACQGFVEAVCHYQAAADRALRTAPPGSAHSASRSSSCRGPVAPCTTPRVPAISTSLQG